MVEKVFEIIDELEKSDLKERIYEVKNKIKDDPKTQKLIKEFNDSKKLYEKYNVSQNFIEAKSKLLKNEVINEYISLQNKINLICLQINDRIKSITKGVTYKK